MGGASPDRDDGEPVQEGAARYAEQVGSPERIQRLAAYALVRDAGERVLDVLSDEAWILRLGAAVHTVRIVYRADIVSGELRSEADGSIGAAVEWVDVGTCRTLRLAPLAADLLLTDSRAPRLRLES